MAAAVERKIMLKRIAHVYYIHENLEKENEFLLDFGTVTFTCTTTQKTNENHTGLTITSRTPEKIYYNGYGTEPFVLCAISGPKNEFGGAAFAVESLSDLELASKTLPNATAIHPLDGPGGGQRVTFTDPVDGYPFHLVFGQEEKSLEKKLPELEYNYPAQKHRAVNKTQRFKQGPAPIHKLGHFGTCVTNFAKAYEFYTSRFNLKASELVYGGDGKDITTFLHLDRGMEQVDHHCFFFFEGKVDC